MELCDSSVILALVRMHAGDREAAYAFVFPNLMINRYGPWMDTNVVVPEGPERCTVQFEYFLDDELCEDTDHIASNLCSSDQVALPCCDRVDLHPVKLRGPRPS